MINFLEFLRNYFLLLELSFFKKNFNENLMKIFNKNYQISIDIFIFKLSKPKEKMKTI